MQGTTKSKKGVVMEVEKDPEKKSNAGKWGCLVAIILLVIIIILIATGLINSPV